MQKIVRNEMKSVEVRNAATVILLRGCDKNAKVLMGQRGKKASFMPDKFVFPGGAVDQVDSEIIFDETIINELLLNLKIRSESDIASAILAAGIRELWEETGLILGSLSKNMPDILSGSWMQFFSKGYEPDAKNMDLVFRAITPPGQPRRFDARFFLVNAKYIHGDLDDFSHASGELSDLQWISLNLTERLDLPIITQIVLKEVRSIVNGNKRKGFPFYYQEGGASHFERLERF